EESNTMILLLLIMPGTSRTHNYVNIFSVALVCWEGHRRVCSNRGPAYGEKPEEYTGQSPIDIHKHPAGLKAENWLRIYLPMIKMRVISRYNNNLSLALFFSLL